MLEIDKIYEGDCLELMPEIPDKSVDMILCDLPYGTTACKWDQVIPFEPLWKEYKRIIKDNGAIVLTSTQPFTTALISSNMCQFKYCWVWDKVRGVGFQIAKYRPMMQHEDIVVFGDGRIKYNQQMIKRTRVKRSKCYTQSDSSPLKYNDGAVREYTEKHPTSIITISNANQSDKAHPTQKPVALFEYLIKTYTNKGDLVLDNCIGSGTTAIAALNTGRHFIGIEKEPKYVEIARKRIASIPTKLTAF